jgi:hypothetical protein
VDAYASFHTVFGTALSVVFDLQVDINETSFFSLPLVLSRRSHTATDTTKYTLTAADREENVRS